MNSSKKPDPPASTAPSVILAGAANLDVLGFTREPLILRDSNPGHIQLCTGGVSRNIAENLSRLGIRTELITAVGSGIDGRFILENCASVKIGTEHALIIPGTTSSMYLALMDHTGDMALALSDMSISDHLTPEYLETCSAALSEASAIVADTCLPYESLDYLLTAYPAIPSYIDPVSVTKGRKLIPLAGKIHTLKMNLLEAEAISGIPSDTVDSIDRIGDWFLEQGTREVFITLGAEGVCWYTIDERGQFRLPPAAPVNATGAGDAFTAGVVFAGLSGYTLAETVRFSAAAAALTLLSEETVNPLMNLDAVSTYLKEHGYE